jgi:hypothetical protein
MYLIIEIKQMTIFSAKNATLQLLLSFLCCGCYSSLKVEKGGMQLKRISVVELQKGTLFAIKMQHCISCCPYFVAIAAIQ